GVAWGGGAGCLASAEAKSSWGIGFVMRGATIALKVSVNCGPRICGAIDCSEAAKSSTWRDWSTLTTPRTGAFTAYAVTTNPPRLWPTRSGGSVTPAFATTAATSSVIANAL